MTRGRSVLVTLVAMLLVTIGWSGVSADVRRPIATKGLWWGEVQGVAVDAGGDVYLTGVTGSPKRHMVVRRYARGGRLVWERTWVLPGGWRWSTDARGGVAVDPHGGVYVAGLVRLHSGDVEEFPDIGAFVRAYGPMGALRWQRIVHLRDWQDEIATGVAAGSDLVVMTGYSTCFECEGHEGWVRAWSANGRPLWTDDFEFAGIADEKRDMATAVAVDRDGSVYVTGVVDRQEDEYGGGGPPADAEVVIRRMTAGGRTVWTRVLSDRSEDSDRATSIAVRDGRVVVGALFGAFDGGGPAPHPWVRASTTDGFALWTRTWAIGVDWYDEPAVAIGRQRRVFVALPTPDAMLIQGRTAAGWLRWTSWLDGAMPAHLAVHEPFVRVSAQRPGVDRALLFTVRA